MLKSVLPRSSTTPPFVVLPIMGISCGLLMGIAASTLAHNVEISEEVAATLHIEPHDTPKAGSPALAWFALTRKGGQLIPIEECNCKLKIYAEPHQAGTPPQLEPPLTAVNAEQYQGIPGAKIVFPKVGRYTLELSGTPKGEAAFKPFDLRYSVTVASGPSVTSPPPVNAPTPSPSQTVTPQPTTDAPLFPWTSFIVPIALLTGLAVVLRVSVRRKP